MHPYDYKYHPPYTEPDLLHDIASQSTPSMDIRYLDDFLQTSKRYLLGPDERTEIAARRLHDEISREQIIHGCSNHIPLLGPIQTQESMPSEMNPA